MHFQPSVVATHASPGCRNQLKSSEKVGTRHARLAPATIVPPGAEDNRKGERLAPAVPLTDP